MNPTLHLSPTARLICGLGPLGLPRSIDAELLDSEDWADEELRESFGDIEWVNRFLGGTRLTIRAVTSLLTWMPARAPVRILDVGAGSCDIPRALISWGHQVGRTMSVVAGDAHERILRVAAGPPTEGLEFRVLDARSLPFGDGAFDVVTTSMLLHHLGPDEALDALKEMCRVATVGVVVNDLIRSRLNLVMAQALFLAVTRNRITRHDGPLSIRRAYTISELIDLLSSAGLPDLRISQFAFYRAAITARIA